MIIGMQELVFTLLVVAMVYLLASVFLYFYQRKLIYFPVGVDPDFNADEITIDSHGTRLHGWILNPGKSRALIYFGGNSELITHRDEFFQDVFGEYSVYLINYRGYGHSRGEPTESGLLADALAIYDQIASQYDSVSAYGRSLGSGVATFLAARRSLEKLILLTPYDSIANVAKRLYPIFPVRWLIKDRFDSASLAGQIDIPVLIAAAEQDREIRPEHTLALKQQLTRAKLTYVTIDGAAHNDIVDFGQYRAAVKDFVVGAATRPDGY